MGCTTINTIIRIVLMAVTDSERSVENEQRVADGMNSCALPTVNCYRLGLSCYHCDFSAYE